jgi:hypothetical protein
LTEPKAIRRKSNAAKENKFDQGVYDGW